MQQKLNLHRLQASLDYKNIPIYKLNNIYLNEYIGKKFRIEFLNEINCIACGVKTKKSFSKGYCFMCMRKLPECDICMIKPELCHYAQGTCRDLSWGEKNCIQTHIVYIANTGNIKVGITKLNNVPSRWIDQGAIQALPIFAVKNRLISGLVENVIKNYIADKTNWRKMLQGCQYVFNLITTRDNIIQKSSNNVKKIKAKYFESSIQIVKVNLQTIHYPVLEYPVKIKLLNLDQNPIIEDTLMGIKGQYLIFNNGVININKFSGYKCNISD